MTKIAVVHPSWNVAGGAERVSAKIIEALKELGFHVSLITIDRVDWNIVDRRLSLTKRPDEELYFKHEDISDQLNQGFRRFLSFYLKLSSIPYFLKNQGFFDYVISSHGETINLFVDIAYINSIPLLMPLYDSEEWFPSLRPIKKVYTDLHRKVSHFLNRKTIYITNSKFMRNILHRIWNIDPIIINPPVNVKKYVGLVSNRLRENIVITISRIKWNKGLNKIPLIAKNTSRNIKFIIIGLSKGSSIDLINYIEKKSRELGVKDKVKILLDLSFKETLNILLKSKIYLHTMNNEAFGISIVEAMASGCIPVVPQRGGPWTDILDGKQGVYGYGYKTLEEASYFIDYIMENRGLWKNISERAMARSLAFDEHIFKSRIKKILKSTISNTL